jgi:L-cysteate sulfo-lyase
MSTYSAPVHRLPLATWPTPVEAAPRLAEAIGLAPAALWLKRDDLTGLAAGGNKIRKLEWTVAAALEEGADTLVTTGAPQSNHARLTAAAAARAGLGAVLVLAGTPPEESGGNLLLDGLLGAEIVWAGESDGADEQTLLDDAARSRADRLRAEGRRPAIIPFGGSNAIGAHGYRLAAAELLTQLPRIDHVVTALGSGGTMAGLVAGLGTQRVLGVHTGAIEDPRGRVAALLGDMAEPVDPDRLRVRADQVGDGYQTLTPAVAEALRLAARTHGLVLDPTYSGRALAGLRAEVDEGRIGTDDVVVLLVSGGLPGLFGHPAAARLVQA